MQRANLLGRGVLDELNALGDVALEAVVGGLEQLLLVVVSTADNVNRLLGTVGLKYMSVTMSLFSLVTLTPSSMGTEKKSVPVVLPASKPLVPFSSSTIRKRVTCTRS